VTDSRRIDPIANAIVFTVAALGGIVPIQSYDYYWHLATGRWISEHHALPVTDPFALATDPIRWIDGEWLFQLPLYAVHSLGGDLLVTICRALGVATLMLFLFMVLKRTAGIAGAAAIVSIAWLGADHRLGMRPETVATACVLVAVMLLLRKPFRWREFAFYLLITVIWINVHPSALLAPVIAGAALAGGFFSGLDRGELLKRAAVIPASALALLLNPFGISGVSGPIRLASLVRSGEFVNREWLPSSPLTFPLLYVSAILALLVLIRVDQKRLVLDRVLMLLLFTFLAFRFVRNQGFFFLTAPLLIAPAVPAFSSRRSRVLAGLLASIDLLLLVQAHGGFHVGADRRMFPVGSVAQLRAAALPGNIYNPDQFGGYLIWNFYPQRRVLTDGRNELYRSFLREYAVARTDGRSWNALLSKYRIALAVDEFHSEHLDVVDAATGRRSQLPASLIYFPRAQWALIGFDDVSMVFARRSQFSPAVLAPLEFATLVPDGADPIVSRTPEGLTQARREIDRARRSLGQSRIVGYLERRVGR